MLMNVSNFSANTIFFFKKMTHHIHVYWSILSGLVICFSTSYFKISHVEVA